MTINYKTSLLVPVGIFIIILALSVITGWLFDIPVLKSIFPGFISMKINTAICFLLSGVIFTRLAMDKWNNACRFIAFFILVTILIYNVNFNPILKPILLNGIFVFNERLGTEFGLWLLGSTV